MSNGGGNAVLSMADVRREARNLLKQELEY